MSNRAFVSRPDQLEEKLAQWKAEAGERLKLDYELSYSGHKVYALTFSDWTVPATEKVALYVAQPHAHEPAATAGIVDAIEQLVCGKTMQGEATKLDVEQILAKLIITFNPIGNPSGSARGLHDYYDGTKITNMQLWQMMRGADPDQPDTSWHRFDVFDTREVKAPDPIGVVYEPVDDFRYVEPNRSHLSSYFRLFRRMDEQYRYRYWLDLHQTEFVKSATQCCILLPFKEAVPGTMEQENIAWAEQITRAWQEAGYTTVAPRSSGYTGVQAEYFRQTWSRYNGRIDRLTVEVKNNGIDVPAIAQMKAQALAIETTLRRIADSL